MAALADWAHAVVDIPEGGLQASRSATAQEKQGLAAMLNILTIDALDARYRIERLAGGGYRLKGEVDAAVKQPCVVSLEPVAQEIAETFDVEFWPELETGGSEGEQSVLEAPETEPIENGGIPAGRVIFETVSAALDPYPRKEGAEFQWRDDGHSGDRPASPFDILSRLKDKG